MRIIFVLVLILLCGCSEKKRSPYDNFNVVLDTSKDEAFNLVLKKIIINIINHNIELLGLDYDGKNTEKSEMFYCLLLTKDYENSKSALLTISKGMFYDDETKGYYSYVGNNMITLQNSVEEIMKWEPKLLELVDITKMTPIDGNLPGYKKNAGKMANNDSPTWSYRIINRDSLQLVHSMHTE